MARVGASPWLDLRPGGTKNVIFVIVKDWQGAGN